MMRDPGQLTFAVAIHLRGCHRVPATTGAFHRETPRPHYRLYAVLDGEYGIDIGGRSCVIVAGAGALVPPGEGFRCGPRPDNAPAGLVIIHFDVLHSSGRDPLGQLLLPTAVPWQRPGLQRQLAQRCAKLAPLDGQVDPHDRQEASGLAQALLMNHIAAGLRSGRLVASDHELPGWLNTLVHEIDDSFGDRSWTVSEMAAHAGLSTSRFAHVFKAEMGQPPKTWLRQRSLVRAAQLLMQHPEWSVARVARQCGWRNPDEFARRFKAWFGHPPSQEQQKSTARPAADATGRG